MYLLASVAVCLINFFSKKSTVLSSPKFTIISIPLGLDLVSLRFPYQKSFNISYFHSMPNVRPILSFFF